LAPFALNFAVFVVKDFFYRKDRKVKDAKTAKKKGKILDG
jgi:hypothetical protein